MHDPENYDELKNLYNGPNGGADEVLPPIFDAMKIRSGKNHKILDFGCGSGGLTYNCILPIAKETNSTILGLDVSESMIKCAAENYSSDRKRLTFKCGDIMSDEFDLGENEFDHIVSYFVLHFIKDYKKAIKRLYELLKPGGKCGLTVSAKHNQFISCKSLGQDPKWSCYMNGYENFLPVWSEMSDDPVTGEAAAKGLIGKAAQEVGFKILELSLNDWGFTCASQNLHAAFLMTLNPFLNEIPRERHSELHRSILTHICNHYGDPDTEEFHSKPYNVRDYVVLTVVLEKPSN